MNAIAHAQLVRPAARRQDALALTYHRLMLMMLVFAGVTMLIVGRLIFLQLFTDRAVAATGNPLLPARADIVDRNGVPLARTIDAWSIAIHPRKLLGDPGELAVKLNQLMPERSVALYRAILTTDKNFVYLNRRAVPELVAAVNALGEPAIVFDREPERLYPQTAMAGHILGWTDFDGRGVTGMEKVLDKRLSDPELRGTPVTLSIDTRIQAAMESALGAAVVKHSALGATGIVLDVRTGELIAMASLPTFNPNAAGKSDANALFNRATMGVYELGSTFKPITVAAAMEAGVIKSMAQRYPSGAPLAIGRFRIKDDHPIPGSANIVQTLVQSSNIVSAQIADQMGPVRMQAAFRAVGFDEPAHIELDQKGKTLWPAVWGRATVLTSAYGHGVAISPLHLASAYAALVNGGVWRPATLMRVDKAPQGRRVYSEATSFKMRQMLRMIVKEGTGRKGEAPGFRVGGKTGTAEKSQSGGYSKKVNVSTFAAAFPMDDPRYVVIAMLDAPKGTSDTFGFTTAAWTAAPVVSKVISRAGPLLGVIPDDHTEIDLTEVMPLVGKKPGH
ncbi:MAG TPA: penicillin-binding protein 2 [Allosphingosinicella sp.]|jgi:cell division protein FtsI (penicillin-binding protein 3)